MGLRYLRQCSDAVLRLLDSLGDDLERYILASSISAYGCFTKPGLTEVEPVPDATEVDVVKAPSLPLAERASSFAYGASYGLLKRACERAATDRLGGRATTLRVGLLVGAEDYTDRLTWWVRRIDEAKAGHRELPAPCPPSRAVQMIDVRGRARRDAPLGCRMSVAQEERLREAVSS